MEYRNYTELAKISSDLAQLRQDIASPDSAINQKLAAMQSQIDQQASVIKHRQQFLEAVDRRERETKLVILGVPDEGEDLAGATTDENKFSKIWSVIGEEVRIRGRRRLGRRDANSTRKRPILVVETKQVRDGLLSKAKKLKEEDQTCGRIYIKKDVHPCVRNEWKRLREAEKSERERPENVGSVNGSELRGGTTVLVRRSLHTSVLRVDTSSPDQGLYKYLHRPCSRPGVATVGVYGGRAVRVLIHTALRLSVLQPGIVWRCTGEDQVSHCDDESCDSRGYERQVWHVRARLAPRPRIPDPVNVASARTLATLCIDAKLPVINNLMSPTHHFKSVLTYRKAAKWKSELDICIASASMVNYLRDFVVWQDKSLPSDHAPFTVSVVPPRIEMASVCSRAKQLGDPATLYNYSSSALVKPPVKFSNMNVDILRDMLTQHDMPMRRDSESINEYVDAFANGLHTFSKESYRVVENQSENLTLERWNRLLNDTDDNRVWRAIDWKGEYKETNINRVCPSNNQLQSLF
ncbi:uncharacterized protein [Penaeus vannamei]|uniref:uncharacterized protein n=1 Tax=Penaeus vannamei TaxID=6689 RepID=UPI00387FAAF4